MKMISAFFLLLISISAQAQVTPANFSQAWNEYNGQSYSYPNKDRYRFVFVGGFLSEGLKPKYFNENIAMLKKSGVPESLIHKYFPSSAGSVWDNGLKLGEALKKFKIDGRYLIVIAHSKGAIEAFTAAAKNSEWFVANVHAVFMVQGAFGGSQVANMVTYMANQDIPYRERATELHRQTSDMPKFRKVAFRAAANAGSLLTYVTSAGIQSITTHWAEQYQRDLYANNTQNILNVQKKLFYVTSNNLPDDNMPGLEILGEYLYQGYGSGNRNLGNDGLVEESKQYYPNGTRLASLTADHAGLTVDSFLSKSDKRLREGLMYAIMRTCSE